MYTTEAGIVLRTDAPSPGVGMVGTRKQWKPSGARTRFVPGQVVRHAFYDYRGIIVHTDPECEASDEWYEANLTHPDRNQPWYSILVDERTHCTYVAEENLVADPSSSPVEHPLLEVYFTAARDGHYERNSREWPLDV
jgi:heat shock protein HspQ